MTEYFQRLSLKSRFRLFLLAVVFVLSLVTIVLLPKIYLQGMIDSSTGVLFAQANDFESRYLADHSAKPVQTNEIQSYLAVEEIPQALRSRFDIRTLKYDQAYLKEWHEDSTIIVCYFYKSKVGDTGTTLYQFQKIDVQKRPEHAFSTIRAIQWAFSAVGIAMVMVVSHLLVRQVVNPIASLHNWVTQIRPGVAPPALPSQIRSDEIGHVAEMLRSSLQRNYDLQVRERHFLQSASHELRTPITVIQNAAELARRQIQLGRGNIQEPLSRIERSCQKMKAVTESLLWLNRIRSHKIEKTLLNVNDCVQSLANDIFCESREEWRIQYHGQNVTCLLPRSLFEICVGNILRNAYQHAFGKSVSITIENNEVTVANEVSPELLTQVQLNEDNILAGGITSNSGFGIGLMLTAKISKSCGWHFLVSIRDGGAHSTLTFDDAAMPSNREVLRVVDQDFT